MNLEEGTFIATQQMAKPSFKLGSLTMPPTSAEKKTCLCIIWMNTQTSLCLVKRNVMCNVHEYILPAWQHCGEEAANGVYEISYLLSFQLSCSQRCGLLLFPYLKRSGKC